MSKIDDAVLALARAIESSGLSAARAEVGFIYHTEPTQAPWQAALIEGIADAIHYAECVRLGKSRLHVQFKPGSSATWEWVRGERISGGFREAIEESVARLLDGEAPDAR